MLPHESIGEMPGIADKGLPINRVVRNTIQKMVYNVAKLDLM